MVPVDVTMIAPFTARPETLGDGAGAGVDTMAIGAGTETAMPVPPTAKGIGTTRASVGRVTVVDCAPACVGR